MATTSDYVTSTITIIAFTVIVVTCTCVCKKKKERNSASSVPPAHNESDVVVEMRTPLTASDSLGNSTSWFSYEELETATGGFAKSNLLGEGGFGFVYKGVFPGGRLVAVKQLKLGGGQGEKEFRAEVEIISMIHHRHLVSLVGYCIADTQRLLVYDYVPNNTLEYHLHRRKEEPIMDWPTRLKVAFGAARGLAYLHEDCHPRIIHRDIKSSNILLDNNFDAQVSDFGLAKLTSDANTHVSTRVMGTLGYMAPEYASTGKLTEKSDVFSFGVVLLELVTGRKSVDTTQPLGEESLVEWARTVLMQVNGEEDLELLADPSLKGVYDRNKMFRMVQAAAACVRRSALMRPTMGQVARALGEDADLSKGVKPGKSVEYVKRFQQEYGSEYSGCTSDSGINPWASSEEHHTSQDGMTICQTASSHS